MPGDIVFIIFRSFTVNLISLNNAGGMLNASIASILHHLVKNNWKKMPSKPSMQFHLSQCGGEPEFSHVMLIHHEPLIFAGLQCVLVSSRWLIQWV